MQHAEPEENVAEWRPTRDQFRTLSMGFSTESLPPLEGPFTAPPLLEIGDSSDEEGAGVPPRQDGQPSKRTELDKGVLRWCPDLHDWVVERIGERSKAWILLTYCGVTAIQVLLFEYTGWDSRMDEVDALLTFVVACCCSFALALALSFLMEGPAAAMDQILNWQSFWRFLMVGMLFVLSVVTQTWANMTNLHIVLNDLLGYTCLPITIFVSFRVFQRTYGRLEWLSTAILSFSIIAFFLVRDRCYLNDCHKLFFWNPSKDKNPLGILLVLMSTTCSACASIFSEWLYKRLSKGEMLSEMGYRGNHLWICKVHLDFAMMQASGWIFVGLMLLNQDGRGDWPVQRRILVWTRLHVLYIVVSVAQLWLTALVTKRYNTVIRIYAYTIMSTIVIFFGDPISGNKYHFGERWLVSLSLLIIVSISMLIFQTGRLNLKIIRRSLNLEPLPRATWRSFQEAWLMLVRRLSNVNLRDGALLNSGGMLGALLLYILADGMRTVLASLALRGSMSTPAVYIAVSNLMGFVLANVLILKQHGRAALAEPWNGRKVLNSMLCGLLFALAATLQTLAYAMGISPGLAMVVGRFYTPIMAILQCFIMNKYFNWLEWLAIAILSLANLIYGLLQAQATSANSSTLTGKSTLVPSAFVLGSAVTACVNSLIFERLMKTDKAPFVIHKVRVDFGSVVFSVLFLPVLGVLSTRDQDAFWKVRASTKQCMHLGSCSSGSFEPYNPDADLPGCECVSGLFVGWGHPIIFLALATNVFYSWITGVVVNLGGSFYRTIADGYSLAVVYFILDPLFGQGERGDWALSFVCILVPLGCLIHTSAESEMKKVMDSISKRTTEDFEIRDAFAEGSPHVNGAIEDREQQHNDGSSSQNLRAHDDQGEGSSSSSQSDDDGSSESS